MAKKVKPKVKSKEPKKMGRPPIYDKKVADDLCKLIANSSKGLHHLCKIPGMPSYDTVMTWLFNANNNSDYKDFSDNYARAREAQADFLAFETVELADNERRTDTVFVGGESSGVTTSDNTQRTKQQIETRKWVASKLAPKKYGDKVQTEVSGSLGITQITGMEIK